MRLLVIALLAGGCGTKACKDQTVLVALTLSGASAQADSFDVTVVVGGSDMLHANGVARSGTASEGTLEIDFPKGFPAGKSIDVTVDARQMGVVVGSGHNTTTLSGSCGNLSITVSALSPDLSVLEDLSVVESGVPDLSDVDLEASPSPSPGCVLQPGATAYVAHTAAAADDAFHGGGLNCPFRTITYALGHASATINVAAGTYNTAELETFPLILNGTQKLVCDPTGTHLAGAAANGMLGGAPGTMIMNGTDTLVSGCVLDSTGQPGEIGLLENLGMATIVGNRFNGYPRAILWEGVDIGVLNLNIFNGSSALDIECGGVVGPTGGGNSSNAPDVGGKPTCIGCTSCSAFADPCGSAAAVCCPGQYCATGTCVTGTCQ